MALSKTAYNTTSDGFPPDSHSTGAAFLLPSPEPTPRLRAFHYGYVIILLAAAGHYMSAPGQTYCISAMVDPMLVELEEIDRSDYSLAYLVGTILAGCLLPISGSLVDRFGARATMPIAGVLLGLACTWMSQLESLAALYFGFLMLRCFGQGMLPLFSNWLIGEWFQKRRGMAIGIIGIGGALSTMTIPWLANQAIKEADWRYAWMFLATMTWILMIAPPLLFIRNRPEAIALFPDLRFTPPPLENNGSQVVDNEPSWTRAEALCDLTFWKLLTVGITSALVGTALMFHQVALLGAHGVSRDFAIELISLQAGVGIVSTLVFGYLTDRLPAQKLLALSMVLLALDTLLLIYLPTPQMAILYAVIMGLFGGIIRTAGQVTWINYYGRKNQGAVCGAALSVMVVASGIGPYPLAWSEQKTGSFTLGLSIFLILPIISAACVWTARKPTKKSSGANA